MSQHSPILFGSFPFLTCLIALLLCNARLGDAHDAKLPSSLPWPPQAPYSFDVTPKSLGKLIDDYRNEAKALIHDIKKNVTREEATFNNTVLVLQHFYVKIDTKNAPIFVLATLGHPDLNAKSRELLDAMDNINNDINLDERYTHDSRKSATEAGRRSTPQLTALHIAYTNSKRPRTIGTRSPGRSSTTNRSVSSKMKQTRRYTRV